MNCFWVGDTNSSFCTARDYGLEEVYVRCIRARKAEKYFHCFWETLSIESEQFKPHAQEEVAA